MADSVRRATTLRERTRGLIGQQRLDVSEALVISRARRIHTIGMSYAIDVLFCDREMGIIHIVRGMRPNRLTRYVRSARLVIEVLAGAASGLSLGDRIEIVQGSSSER